MEYLKDLTQDEIEKMVDDGRELYWSNKRYKVIKDSLGQYLVTCKGGSAISLKGHFTTDKYSDDFFEE